MGCHLKLEKLERMHSEKPRPAPWFPILVIHIRSQVKTRQSQSYKLKKKNAKNSNFEISQETLHMTRLLMLLDKIYTYKMGPTGSAAATEWTRDAGRTDGVKPIYPPTTSLIWVGISVMRDSNGSHTRKQFELTWCHQTSSTNHIPILILAWHTRTVHNKYLHDSFQIL